MATVLDLITEALVTVKALAVGEAAPADMTSDALTKFNDVIEALSLQNLAVYSTITTTLAMVPGTGVYTIGASGGTVAQRPLFINDAWVTYAGSDFHLMLKTEDEYGLLSLKSQPGLPSWLVYEPDYPNGTLRLWPVPSESSTLTLVYNKSLAQAITLTDDFVMPPGYRRMIRLMLAWELASDYAGLSGVELDKMRKDTVGAIALVKRNAKKPALMRSEVAQLSCSRGGYGWNWRDGV